MKIEFDPRDANACASVIAAIAALHRELPFAGTARFESADPTAATEFPDEQPAADPAEAFGSPNPAEAFAGNAPPVSPAEGTAVAITPTPAVAPSPVAVTTPTPVSAPIAPPTASVELDAAGLPWDARIHSGPADKRPKNGDGTWRRKRGADDALVAAVEAELRQVMGAPPSPLAAPTPAPVPAAPAPVAPVPTPAPVPQPPTPAPAPMESGGAVADGASSAPIATFTDLMRKVTRMQTAGILTVAETTEIAQAIGLTALRDLLKRPDLVPSFDALLPAEAA